MIMTEIPLSTIRDLEWARTHGSPDLSTAHEDRLKAEAEAAELKKIANLEVVSPARIVGGEVSR